MDLNEPQANLFKVLMHPVRLAILEILRDGEQCVCHMVAVLGLRQAYISQQLMVLREAGLIEDRRDGWNIFYRVVKPEIYPVLDAARIYTGEDPANGIQPDTNPRSEACQCPKCAPETSPIS